MLRRIPILLGVLVLVGHVALLYRATVSHTDGSFCYPLDDTFIHMAIARTIAHHGVFGVTPQGFAGASSSVLWPLILAAVDRVAGDHLLTPLLLNLAFGCVLVAAFARFLERAAPQASIAHRTLWVLAMVLLAPLSTIVVVGMEHTLHILIVVLLLQQATRWLTSEPEARGPTWPLLILAFLATALRYESLFLAGIVAFLVALRRDFRLAAAVLGAAALPVVAFGLYSISHGGLFLPGSILLKGTKLRIDDISDVGDLLGGNFFTRVAAESHMLAAPLAGAFVLALAAKRCGAWSAHTIRLAIVVLTALAHIEFASLGWFFRYEAYLVVLLLGSIGAFVCDQGPRLIDWVRLRWGGAAITGASALVAILSVGPLVRRAIQAAQTTPSACRNIYDQQVQNARFLRRYFPNEPVAINDIGAVAYYGGMPIVDLAGLATLSIARAKHFQMFRPPLSRDVAAVTAETRVAIVYDEWVPYHPQSWTLLGRWRIASCGSCFSPVVNVYATKPEAIPAVVAALRDFAGSMPEDVSQEGIYASSRQHSDPSAPDFVLGSGDVLHLHLPGLADEEPVETVGDGGSIAVPFVRLPVQARGRTLAQLSSDIDAAYASARSPEAKLTGPTSVELVEPRWLRYVVAGEVPRPGTFFSPAPPRVGDVLARCGVRTDLAGERRPYALRRNAADDYVRTEVTLDASLEPLDVLVVP